MARVVVFGGRGLAGSAIVRELQAHGHEVIAPSRAEADLRGTQAPTTVGQAAPHVVIDAAGAPRGPEGAASALVEGAGATAAAARGVGAFTIYISCAAVYDAEGAVEHGEDEPVAPASRLGHAKARAEQAVARYNDRHAVVRSSWLYGGHQDDVVERIIEAGRARDWVTFGSSRGSPTPVAALAAWVRGLVGSPDYGTFHVASSGSCSELQLARNIFRIAGINCEARPVAGSGPALPLPPPGAPLATVREHTALRPWRDDLATYLSARAASPTHFGRSER